jgi:hypothetical protein
VRVESEEPRALGPQERDPHGDRAVVVLARRRPPQRCLEEATAQVPVPQLPEQRLAGGEHQRQQVPLHSAVAGPGRRRGDLLRGQPVQLRGVVHPDGGGLRGQLEVLPERRRQGRQLLVELGEPCPARLVEPGTGQDEVQVVALDEADGFGVQAAVVPRGVHGVQAGEELRVQAQGVVVRGLQRRDLALDLPHARRGHRRRQVPEHRPGPAQQPARPLQRHHGVVERGLLARVADGARLLPLLRHPGEQGLAAVLGGDVGERRQGERQRRGPAQRIVGGHGRGGVGAHRRPSCATVSRG